MGALKEIRLEKKLTQQETAKMLGVSLRSYKSYENDIEKEGSIKYKYMLQVLTEYNRIDETHGILDVADICEKCAHIFMRYEVNFCYLFGSYAKKTATGESDVDLLVSCNVSGLQFYGMIEEIRETLHKKVDLLTMSQLRDNLELIEEILRDGIKIYG